MIPSERELAERFGLSRSTVRLAIQELEYLGRIVRKQGRGTFVADRLAQATNLTQSYSFTEQMKAMGRLPETTILEFCEMEADKTLSMQMGIHLGEKVLKLKRLRMADGIPMMVERSYLPARLFISLKRPLLEQKPLYDVIEQDYQQKIRVADEEFSAGIARPCDARLLGIGEGAPVLDIVRTTHNTQMMLSSSRFRWLVRTSLSTGFLIIEILCDRIRVLTKEKQPMTTTRFNFSD